MAITKCKECGGQISTKAKTCPHCGAAIKKGSWLKWIGVLVLLFLVAYVVGMFIQALRNTPSTENWVLAIDQSPEAHAKREALMEDLLDKGIWLKVEKPATLPHAYTGPMWPLLNIDEKEAFASATLVHYAANDRNATILIIYDGSNGKEIGKFSSLGLDLD